MTVLTSSEIRRFIDGYRQTHLAGLCQRREMLDKTPHSVPPDLECIVYSSSSSCRTNVLIIYGPSSSYPNLA